MVFVNPSSHQHICQRSMVNKQNSVQEMNARKHEAESRVAKSKNSLG